MAESGKTFIKKFLGFSLVPWITFALSFITAPISTRLFDPSVLGKINIFNTYASLFGMFALVGLDQAFARFYNERPNNRSRGYLFTFCFAITYSLLFILAIISIPLKNVLSGALFDESDNLLLTLLFISVFCSSSLRYLNLAYRMEQDIKMYTIQGVLMALASKVIYICVGFWDPSYKSAIIVLSISNLLLTVVFLIKQRNRFEMIREYDKQFSNEMFAFAIPLIPVTLLTWINSSLPQIIIQKTMDYYYIGIFSSAMALANLILVIQSGFNTFWVPYTYENYKTQTGQFFKVHRYLVCVLTIFALLIVCSQDIIFLLLGEKYRAAKSFFPFLILGPVCYVIGEVIGVGIEIAKKTYLKLYVFFASVVVNILCCLLLRIPMGIAGIAVATSLAAIVAMIVKAIFGERHYKIVTDYKYVIACIFFILSSAFVTLYVDDRDIRLYVTVGILLVSILFYRTEIKELSKVGLSFIRKDK